LAEGRIAGPDLLYTPYHSSRGRMQYSLLRSRLASEQCAAPAADECKKSSGLAHVPLKLPLPVRGSGSCLIQKAGLASKQQLDRFSRFCTTHQHKDTDHALRVRYA